MLHKETVEGTTLNLIYRLMADDDLKAFKLFGGTALALIIGHRISLDIDLFTDSESDAQKLASVLSSKYQVDNLETENNTINCFIEDVKVDCIAHCYPWIQPSIEVDSIRMASIQDIAAMKLNAIVQDGSRLKDFIDVYVMLEQKSLSELLLAYEHKYPNVSAITARKALLCHNDVRSNQKINLIKKNILWVNVVNRLKQANLDDKRIFKPDDNFELKQTKRLSRGRKIR